MSDTAGNSAGSENRKRALIVVDVQNDFCPGGSLACVGGDEVARRITDYIRSHDYGVVVGTKDWHIDPGSHFAPEGAEPDFVNTWPVHCRAESYGAQSHPNLDTSLVEYWFHKGEHEAAYSGFEGHLAGETVGLAQWLRERGIESVDVCGIATDYCVQATALDAVANGFATRVLLDLCAGVAEQSSREACEHMREAGIDVCEGIAS